MPRLSVTIVARDEELDLPGCLESVAFADEIVVVDSLSADRTVELAKAAGAKVFSRPWPGFAAQKQFALEQATGDWVLNLDADERCSPALAAEIREAMARADADGYELPFETWMFGRRVRFSGLRGERHLRLFRRERANYPAREIHESVEVSGAIARLQAPIVHRTYRTLDEYVDKINRYTSLAARQRYATGRRFSAFAALRWPWGFFKRYVLQLGVLDGWAGFVFAALGGLYDFLKYAKLDDVARAEIAAGEPPPPARIAG